MTLVLGFTVCYTGLRAKVSYPCAQKMTKSDEPIQNQGGDCYQQKEFAIHDIPFGYFCERLSNPEVYT